MKFAVKRERHEDDMRMGEMGSTIGDAPFGVCEVLLKGGKLAFSAFFLSVPVLCIIRYSTGTVHSGPF